MKRGAKINGRTNKTSKVERWALSTLRLAVLIVIFLIGGLVVAGIVFQNDFVRQPAPIANHSVDKPQTSTFNPPHTLAELLDLTPTELEHCDIARMNLLCAEGLPGAENLNMEECLATLDQWARHAKSEIDRNHHRFLKDPAYFSNSEAFYKMVMLAVVVYEDFKVRYNPKLMAPPGSERSDDQFFADSSDVLIHGLAGTRRMGTCSSMPVFYIAMGRRLGYPLKLAKAKGHLFMRWDSPTEKFDMDATGKGVNKLDDDYYKQWPFPISEAEIQAEDYLKSLSAQEELSIFLSIRGACQADNGLLGDSLMSFIQAYWCVPTWHGNEVLMAQARARLARPVIQVQPTMPANPNIPADPNPMPQLIQPRNPFLTP